MYKGVRERKRENLQDVKLTQSRCQNLSMSTTAYSRLAMVMGGVCLSGGSWEVAKATVITRLKMKDAYILCNVIETFLMKKSDQGRKMKAL